MSKTVTVQSQQKWEYHHISDSLGITAVLKKVNEAGGEGWELVSLMNIEKAGLGVSIIHAMLKRPKAG